MKITIIGAGLMGVTSAYFLAKKGYEVEVLERQDGSALETSFANAGMLTPSMADPWNAPDILSTLIGSLFGTHSSFVLRPKALPSLIGWGLNFLNQSRPKYYYENLHRSADLACYSMDVLKRLTAELNLKYDHLATGSLKIFRNKENLEKAAKLSESLFQHDLGFEVIKKDDLLSVDQSLSSVGDTIYGGLYFPDDQSGNAHLFTLEMEKHAQEQGAKFHYGVNVNDFIRDGVTIKSVSTNVGTFTSDIFILSAGSYSMQLARKVGVELPIRPAKGYSISIPMNGWNDGPRMPINDDDYHVAITPLGETLRVAGTAEFAGFDKTLRRDRIDDLHNLVSEIYPDFAKTIDPNEVSEWMGLRPLSYDGSPFIGRTAIENLYLNSGHGPLGWTMAAGSAKMLESVISGEITPLDPNIYSLSRLN